MFSLLSLVKNKRLPVEVAPKVPSCSSAAPSAVLLLFLGADGLQLLLLPLLDGHHASQQGVAQHGAQRHQSRQQLLPALVGHVLEIRAVRRRGRLLSAAF